MVYDDQARFSINSSGDATFTGAINGTTATFDTGTAGTFKVKGTSNGTNVNTGDAGTYLQLQNLSTNADTFTVLQGVDGSGQGTSQIAFVNRVDAENKGQMVFSTRQANGSMTSALTINSTQTATFAGDISVTGDIKVGTAAGTANQYLKKNSSNELAWETVSPGSAGGANAITMNDSVAINFGTDSDLKVSHSGSHGFIQNNGTNAGLLYIDATTTIIRNKAGTTDIAKFVENGACILYNDNTSRFETTANGAKTTGRLEVTEKVGIGNRTSTPDEILHVHASSGEVVIHNEAATDAILKLTAHAGDSKINFGDAGSGNTGAIEYDHGTDSLAVKVNSSNALTISNTQDATFAGSVYVSSDSNKIYAGVDNEMQVFHSGTDSIIKDTRNSGSIKLQADNFSVIDKDAGQTLLSTVVDGATKLFYGGATDPKLETTASGAKVTGVLEVTGNIEARGTSDVRLYLGSTGSTTGNNNVHVRGDAGNLNFMAAENGITKFEVNGTETLNIAANGTATFAGAVSVGGSINETIHTIASASATQDIDPANGTIQRITLSQAGHTVTFTNMTNGESVLLMIDDASSGTVTTWTGVTWVGGTAVTLATTGYSLIEVWKAKNAAGSDTVFACHMGDVA